MKRLVLSNGVVLTSPYEFIDLAQEYGVDNAKELLSLLFSKRGVVAEDTGSLQVSVDPDTAAVTVAPGYAVCEAGPMEVETFYKVSLNGLTQGSYYVNLYHIEETDTPVALLPYGGDTVDLRVKDSFDVALESTPTTLDVGVPLALIDVVPKSSSSGTTIRPESHQFEITDLRTLYGARLRTDTSLRLRTVDPVLIPEIERLMSREGVVDDLFDLLDNKILQGEEVVTKALPGANPILLRTRYEPAFRERLRVWSGAGAQVVPEPEALWRLRTEWNLYGLSATRLADAIGGKGRYQIDTPYDLSIITADENPVYFRYATNTLQVEAVEDTNIVRVVEAGIGPASDSSAAIHNGANEFYVSAHRVQEGQGAPLEGADFSFDDEDDDPAEAEIRLNPGSWMVKIHSVGTSRRNTYTFSYDLPKFPIPNAPLSLSVQGTQAKLGIAPDGDGSFEQANPYAKLAVGSDGEAVIDVSALDRYVEAFADEINRIQKMDVGLDVDITPPQRLRSDISNRVAVSIAYRVKLEALGEVSSGYPGWIKLREDTVYRSAADIAREISWLDVNSHRYRGEVATVGALKGVTFAEGPPAMSDDLVSISTGGLYRYEPTLAEDETTGLTVQAMAANGSGDEGYWVKVSDDINLYQPENVTHHFDDVTGGVDYRVTVTAISESGTISPPITNTCLDLRDKYNARLGFNFYRVMTDIHATSQLLLEQVGPHRIEEIIKARMAEIREIMERASVFGNPPKVQGPYQIATIPGTVTFVGRSLGAVTSVKIRYIPKGETQAQTFDADFDIVSNPGAEPTLVVRDMPNYDDLDRQRNSTVMVEFNAGARGSDFITVSYLTVVPQITSPSVAKFSGVHSVRGSDFLYGNTASYWVPRVTASGGAMELVGPQPKEWLPTNQDANTTAHATLQTEIANGYVDAETASLNGVLRFTGSNLNYESILDVRIRELPTNRLVKGNYIAVDSATYNDYKEVTHYEPHYSQIRINQDSLEVYVQGDDMQAWKGKNFAIEYVYYSSPPDFDATGQPDLCQGLNLSNQGALSANPATPLEGYYYYNTVSDKYFVYRSGAWVEAWPLAFERHTFSTFAADARNNVRKDDKVSFSLEKTYKYSTERRHPSFGYVIPDQHIPLMQYIERTRDAADDPTWATDYATVDGDYSVYLHSSDGSRTQIVDWYQFVQRTFDYPDTSAVEFVVPSRHTAADSSSYTDLTGFEICDGSGRTLQDLGAGTTSGGNRYVIVPLRQFVVDKTFFSISALPFRRIRAVYGDLV